MLAIRDGERTINLPVEEIAFLQSEHVYTKIVTNGNERFLIRKPLTDMMQDLPVRNFIQTHRGFIINRAHVDRWEAKTVTVAGTDIPISRARRKEVERWLSQKPEQ